MLFSLIYTSKAVNLMQDEELQQILEDARRRNLSHNITGILVYIEGEFFSKPGGRFMQVLEGEENAVKVIYEKIKHDLRHHSVTLLNEAVISKRNFKTWSMGFESLKLDKYKQMPTYFELDHSFLSSINVQKFSMPLTFLKSFYELHLSASGNRIGLQ